MQIKIKAIMSYPQLFTAKKISDDGDAKFSVSMVVPKTDTQTIKIIEDAIAIEKAKGFPAGFPESGKCTFKEYPDDPNYMVLSSTSRADYRPLVVDTNLEPVIDPSLVVAGNLAWFSVNIYTYNKAINKGVTAGLNGVMITGEEGLLGELSGRPNVNTMFGSNDSNSPTPVSSLIATAKAEYSIEEYKVSGWTEEQLIEAGLAIKPSFA